MDESLPLDELSNFAQNEKDIITTLGLLTNEKEQEKMKPGKQAIQNILNFSKVHSSRKSKLMNRIELILN